MRRGSWLLCLVCLGCHSLVPGRLEEARPVSQAVPSANSPLLDQVGKALEAGDGEKGCALLQQYVDEHPEARAARALLAEVLYQLGRFGEARAAFEIAVAALQEESNVERLVQCHARLVDLAAAEADEYAAHVHRGIGLYLLAQRRRAEPDPDGELSVESILCKAALELNEAHQLLPTESRAAWYLHRIWRELGQTHAAERWLREAHEHAPFSYLTPQEHNGLQLCLARSSTGSGISR